MSRAEVALTAVGGLLGAITAVALAVWMFVRACERSSERGFGGPVG